jgi:hypothetical protein
MKKNEESFNDFQDKSNYGLNMKKNEELQNEVHLALNRNQFMNKRKLGISARVGKYMKIFSYLILLTGIGLVFNSCMGGYVASEPSYTDYARPPRPSETHIWIDGDWNWNNQTHVYVQKAGYWEKPRIGQSYVAGSWQSSQRGKSWTKGHWQKDNKQKDNRQRDNKQNDNNRR